MLSREDYRRIKNYSKQDMENWLNWHQHHMYNEIRKQYDAAYHDELDNSVQNFLFAIAYCLHFSDDTNLSNDELKSFMDDLYSCTDMFRKGEYKPEDYEEALKQDGIVFGKYDYDKIYREKEGKYQKANQETIKFLEDMVANSKETTFNIEDIQQLIINKLEVE